MRRSIALTPLFALVLALVIPAPAQAAVTNFTADCTSSNAVTFEVNPGDQIIFNLGSSSCQTILVNASATSTLNLQNLVNSIAVLTGTGGTAVASYAVNASTVTYTAGPRNGTDSMAVATLTRWLSPARKLMPRGTADYRMTTLRSSPPPSWAQAYGRSAGATCLQGWNPSWAEWPNSGTGGFVCLRENYYDSSSGTWGYRSR
jgi:hypothetical protein